MRVAVISGANRGIGFEICRQLARRGLGVVLESRSAAKRRAAANKLREEGLPVEYQPLDVTSLVSVKALAAQRPVPGTKGSFVVTAADFARIVRRRGRSAAVCGLLACIVTAQVMATESGGEPGWSGQGSGVPQEFTLPGRARQYGHLGLHLSAQALSEAASSATETAGRSAPSSPRVPNSLVIGTGIALLAAYGATQWYEDGFGGGFKVAHEGWFGKDTKYGGMDKLGHAGFSYASTRWFAAALKATGNDDATARDLSAISVLAAMTAVEVLDGYSRKWKFSYEDSLMNVVGVGLGWLLERYPAADDLIDLRLRYQRSTQPDGTRTGFDPFSDYEGQTYLVVAKASGMPALRDNPWLKYLEFSVGYSARGFDPRTAEPKRYFNYGIGINVGALIEDFVLRNAGAGPKAVNRWFFEYFQLSGAQALGKRSF